MKKNILFAPICQSHAALWYCDKERDERWKVSHEKGTATYFIHNHRKRIALEDLLIFVATPRLIDPDVFLCLQTYIHTQFPSQVGAYSEFSK